MGASFFTIREDKVFHYDVELKGADAATFKAFNNVWARDAKNAYFNSSKKRVKDLESFEALNDYFARDKFQVYLPGTNFEKADRESFEVLDAGTSPLPSNVLSGIDFSAGYARDKNNVYFLNITVKGADPQSFQSLRNRFGLDSKNVFYEGKNLHVQELHSWRPITEWLSCDNAGVYCWSRQVKGADPRTIWLLPPIELGFYRDHAGFYWHDKPVSPAKYYQAFQEQISHSETMLNLFKKGDYFSRQFGRSVPLDVKIADGADQI